MLRTLINAITHGEEGHAPPALAALIAGAGAIALTIGATGDTDWLAWVGGIVLAVGIVAAALLDHVTVDYDIFARLEKLEKK